MLPTTCSRTRYNFIPRFILSKSMAYITHSATLTLGHCLRGFGVSGCFRECMLITVKYKLAWGDCGDFY